MTHYDVLQLPRDATADQIKAAYRKLAKGAHPDSGGDTVRFQELQHAYDVLSSAERREQYDLTLQLEPARQASARLAEHAVQELEGVGVELVRALGRGLRRRLGGK